MIQKQNLLKLKDKNKRNVCLLTETERTHKRIKPIYKYLFLFVFKSFILSFLGDYYEN